MTPSRLPAVKLAVLIALILLVSAPQHPAQAIIIRHDKNYSDYRIMESQFPAVFYLEQQATGKVCVATLIEPQWAITAAHCAIVTSLLDSLRGGEDFPVLVAGREQLIDLLVVHPDFLPGSANEVDLALLRLAQPLDFPRPVALFEGADEAGRVVSLIGWGYFGLGTTGRQYNDGQFRRAENRVETADHRLTIQFDDPRVLENDSLGLEGMPGLGDSGGPALLREDDGWRIAGIAVGEVMGEAFEEETQGIYGSEAVYERVSLHLDWIRRTIEETAQRESE